MCWSGLGESGGLVSREGERWVCSVLLLGGRLEL